MNIMNKVILMLTFIMSILCVYTVRKQEKIHSSNMDKITKDIAVLIESAYLEGQIDAIDGDIRYRRINDSVYVWDKSPWDNNVAVKDTIIRYE